MEPSRRCIIQREQPAGAGRLATVGPQFGSSRTLSVWAMAKTSACEPAGSVLQAHKQRALPFVSKPPRIWPVPLRLRWGRTRLQEAHLSASPSGPIRTPVSTVSPRRDPPNLGAVTVVGRRLQLTLVLAGLLERPLSESGESCGWRKRPFTGVNSRRFGLEPSLPFKRPLTTRGSESV